MTQRWNTRVAAVLLLAACGGGAGDSSPQTTEPRAASTNPPVSESTTTSALAPTAATAVGPSELIASTPVAEHPVTLPNGARFTVDMDAGGAGLWLIMRESGESEANGLIRLDPTNGAVIEVLMFDRPSDTGNDGALAVGGTAIWLDTGDGGIRLDVATGDRIEVDGSHPSVSGDHVWVNTRAEDRGWSGVRVDPTTAAPIASAVVTSEQVKAIFPEAEVEDGDEFPVGNMVTGPGAVWSIEPGLGVIEIDPATGTAIHITPEADWDLSRGGLPAKGAAAIEGGLWILAETATEGAPHALHLAAGSTGFARAFELPEDAGSFDDLAADSTFLYVLGQDGPLWVLDATTGELLKTITHPEFVDNAYAVALADGAVWVAVQDDLVLEYRP